MNELSTPSRGMRKFANWAPFLYFLAGQGAWFASVISAAHGASWIGIVICVLLIAAHVRFANHARLELQLILITLLLGGLWDTGLVHARLIEYAGGGAFPGLAPWWIMTMWALFAAQFNTTYKWLKNRIFAAIILGAFAGPASFRAGAALGALRFPDQITSLLVLAAGWAILLPAITLLSRRWDGVRDPEP